MALKTGDTCYLVVWDGPRIEYWEYVLRTIRTRRGVRYGYWWNKLPGHTWGKLSKKHGDYGWLLNAWAGWREMHPLAQGRPFAATKLGALRDEIAAIRSNIAEFGEDFDFDEDGVTLDRKLRTAVRAQKRLRKSRGITGVEGKADASTA